MLSEISPDDIRVKAEWPGRPITGADDCENGKLVNDCDD